MVFEKSALDELADDRADMSTFSFLFSSGSCGKVYMS